MEKHMICLCLLIVYSSHGLKIANGKMDQILSWKQLGYDFEGVRYSKDADFERKANGVHFIQDLEDSEKFFIQYNNVPIGFEVYGNTVFVTVPRRRYGIPSTLNCIDRGSPSPLLKPYPNPEKAKELVSVYRPRVDQCGRLWMVDTGLLEVPGARTQVQPPSILVYDLKTGDQILKYQLKASDLVNERTSGGLTSITVDVDPKSCENAYAYINDLATEGLIVFSMKERDSWRINHPSFLHNEGDLNFTVAGYVINWKDGLFSIALSDRDASGKRTAFYHPLVSTQEFSVDTKILHSKLGTFDGESKVLGNRGANTRCGSHGYHSGTRTLLFANVAEDAILCWNVDTPLTPDNVATIAQDHQKLVYISDLKIVDDDVWVLVNQMPRFVFSTLNPNESNFFIHSGSIQNLIRGTVCDKKYKIVK